MMDRYTIVTIYEGRVVLDADNRFKRAPLVHAYDIYESKAAAQKEARRMRRDTPDVDVRVIKILERGKDYDVER